MSKVVDELITLDITCFLDRKNRTNQMYFMAMYSEPFKNLRIRAYLKTGVISDQYLPLDGVLYYHLVRREMGEETITKKP